MSSGAEGGVESSGVGKLESRKATWLKMIDAATASPGRALTHVSMPDTHAGGSARSAPPPPLGPAAPLVIRLAAARPLELSGLRPP